MQAKPAIFETQPQRAARDGAATDFKRLAAIASVALLLAGAAARTVDWPSARDGIQHWLDSHDLQLTCKVVRLADVFSDGLGVAAILLLAAMLHPSRRRAIACVAVMALVAGLVSDGVNAALGWAGVCRDEHPLFWLATFAGQLPAGVAPRAPAFLSQHAAVATALALGLARYYPHGRRLFGVFAALAIADRLLFCHDSLPGALAGAALACGAVAAIGGLADSNAMMDAPARRQQRRAVCLPIEQPQDVARRDRRAA